jgi:uncharacterized membrane protein
MDQNVLSPEQRRTLQIFEYNKIKNVSDPNLTEANESLKPLLSSLKTQNDVLQKNVNTLQSLVDTVKPGKSSTNNVLLEEIRWNRYVYKKYHYQTQLLGIIIGICVFLNIFHNAIPRKVFLAGTGFILSVAFVYFLYKMWDLTLRDSVNFDEYSFYNYKGEHVNPKYNEKSNTVDVSNCKLNQIAAYYN